MPRHNGKSRVENPQNLRNQDFLKMKTQSKVSRIQNVQKSRIQNVNLPEGKIQGGLRGKIRDANLKNSSIQDEDLYKKH